MGQFFGYGSIEEMKSVLGEKTSEEITSSKKVKRKEMKVCSRDRGKCAGQLPFIVNGEEVIRFIYWIEKDGEMIRDIENPDDGTTETMCTVEYKGQTIGWSE